MIASLSLLLVESLAGLGIFYTLAAALLVARFGRRPDGSAPVPAEPVTLLKPLYGAEPELAENLASFLDQDWDAPVQMVAGVHAESDPARATVAMLAVRHPGVTCVVDGTTHGANAKIGNIVNMMPAARHDLLIVSDSDMAAPRDYLRRVAAALDEPGVGAVTCLYRGRGDAGFWSVLGAAGLSYHFLPGVIVSLAIGAGDVCMGSTIALRRATLDRIGGFGRFADILADDHAIGGAVRALGLRIAVPSLVLPHGCADASPGELARHERRWAATVRQLNPAGYAGMIVTHPLPFALAVLAFRPLSGALLLGGTLAARLILKRAVDRLCGARTAPFWLMPMRDILSFVVFLGGLRTGSVDWRGERLRMEDDGRISAELESVP